jgi:phosphate:Na+ symporter
MIDWLQLGMGLFGGLALFLFGMEQMAKGLQAAAGESMKLILARLTRNRLLGALTGAIVTAILNSSSVTTVLVVGFVTAGLMSLAQSVGVIMGANVGSTVTAQIIAFNVTQYALGMIAIGFAMLFVGKREHLRHIGSMILGIGMVFFGMGVMGESMDPMRTYQPFLDLMTRMEVPILGILVGAVFTGLVQSSAATTGIAIVMASEGLVTLPAGIALALGANIGTCVTAILAAIGKPTDARRVALMHVLFNVAGVLLWLPFISYLADYVRWLSPAHPDLAGAQRLAAEVPRQIANAHTTFNIINTLLFLPITGLFARLVEKLIPERPVEERVVVAPKFLDDELLRTPSLALERVRLELGHLGEIVQEMLAKTNQAFSRGRREFEEVIRMDDQADLLQKYILDYLGRIRRSELTGTESRDFIALMSASDHLEGVGDTIETSLVEAGLKLIDRNITPSETATELLRQMYDPVERSLDAAVRAIRDADPTAAQEVLALRSEVNSRMERFIQHQAGRLSTGDPKRPAIFQVEMQVMDGLKRIYTLSKRIARVAMPPELQASA